MSKIAKEDKNMEQAVKFMRSFVNDEEVLDIYDKINDVKYYAKEEEKKKQPRKCFKMDLISIKLQNIQDYLYQKYKH